MTKLGFGDVPKPTKIFIAKEQNSLWHFWDSTNKRIDPIAAQSITCYIKAIEYKEFTSDYGTSIKLAIAIEAEKQYEIYTGIDTWFNNSFLLTLSYATDDELSKPITIEPKEGEGKCVFANLYNWQGKRIKSLWQWYNDRGEKQQPDYQQIFSELKQKLENMKQLDPEF